MIGACDLIKILDRESELFTDQLDVMYKLLLKTC